MNPAEYTVSAERLLSGGKWLKQKTVRVRDGKIAQITDGITDPPVPYLVPGLIDNHIHGGCGFRVIDCTEDGMERWLVDMAERGVSGVMLCPYASREQIRHVLTVGRTVIEKQRAGKIGGAILLGVHSEGPFLSPQRPGAIVKETLRAPGIEAFEELFGEYKDLLREMTLAPEEDTDLELTRYLRSIGCKVLAGHTDCDYETATAAFSAGIGATCHTFNAMRPLRHRDPGILAAAMADPRIYCEMIGDTVHLHPGTIRLLYRCKGAKRLMLISDAVGTTGMPDGEYDLPHERVIVRNGESRLPDGTLDGGACFTTESIRRLKKIGLPAKGILPMASSTPAAWLGLPDWDIAVGAPARLSAFDGDLNFLFSHLNGRTYGGK